MELAPTMPGLGRPPNKHFRGALGGAKMASVSTLALLAVTRSPETGAKNGGACVSLRILRFTGPLQSLCGCLHHNEFFFSH